MADLRALPVDAAEAARTIVPMEATPPTAEVEPAVSADRAAKLGGRASGLAQLHLAVLLFGAAGLFGKLVDLTPAPLVLARAGIAAAFVFIVAVGGRRSIQPRRRVDLVVFAAIGSLLAVHWVAFYRSVQVSTVSIAVLAVATFPVFTALLGPLSIGRLPSRRDVVLAVVAFVGVAVIVGRVDLTGAVAQGVLWGVAASALFAVLTIVNERLIVGYPGITVALYQFAVAALVLAPFSLGELASVNGRGWLLLVVFGTLITAVPHTLFIASMRRFASATASLTVSLEPVYGIALAWLTLAETPSPRVLVGGAIILATVAIGTRR